MPNNLIGKKPNVTTKIVYHKRTDLTRDEIRAINHYKDLVNPQYSWDYPITKRKRGSVGIDCYMVNNVLRGTIPQTSLSLNDTKKIEHIVNGLSSAIRKSIVKTEIELLKGIKYFDELETYDVDKTVSHDAFGSFTTSKEEALKYSGVNSENEHLFLHLILRKGSHALYIDADEEEYLIEPQQHFRVRGIVHYAKGDFLFGRKAIVYYLEMIKR